jgi:hypothetical protein
MTSSYVPWWISTVWACLAVLAVFAVDPASGRIWLIGATLVTLPMLALFRLWSDGPPQTVAEVLRATERDR